MLIVGQNDCVVAIVFFLFIIFKYFLRNKIFDDYTIEAHKICLKSRIVWMHSKIFLTKRLLAQIDYHNMIVCSLIDLLINI